MSATIKQSANYIMSQSDFINEITSTNSDNDSCLGKRRSSDSNIYDSQQFRKVMVLGKYDLAPVGVSIKYQGQKSIDQTTDKDQTEGYLSRSHSEQGDFQVSDLLEDQLRCSKILIKHFLIETLKNEKFNLQRFNYLPSNCQSLILTFLERHFDFHLENEVKKSSMRKYLYPIKGKTYQTTGKSPVALSFLTDCYVYGLSKQLQKNGKQITRKQVIDALYCKLVENQVNLDKERFHLSIESILKYGCESLAEASRDISETLLQKMSQIQELTLTKFYGMRLRKQITELIDECETTEDLQFSIEHSSLNFDILTAYIGKESSPSIKYYHTNTLDII